MYLLSKTATATTLAALLAFIAPAVAGPLSPTSTVDQVLDALHDRGQDLKSFTTKVRTEDYDKVNDASTVRNGTAAYLAGPGTNVRIHLLLLDRQTDPKKPAVKERKEYLLSDGWVTDRDFTINNESRRQLVPAGQKVNLFQLDNGLFPLPIGLSRTDVLKNFNVNKADSVQGDPPNTLHLSLVPRPGSRAAGQFSAVDLWVDLSLAIPVRIFTVDVHETKEITTDLTDLKVNPTVPDSEFAPSPLPANWKQNVLPLQ